VCLVGRQSRTASATAGRNKLGLRVPPFPSRLHQVEFGDGASPARKPPLAAGVSRAAGVKRSVGENSDDAAREWACVASNSHAMNLMSLGEAAAAEEARPAVAAAGFSPDHLQPSEAVEGRQQLGSARVAAGAASGDDDDGDDDDDDDEFGYAFTGGRRAAPSHVKKFAAVPTHLVSNVRGSLMSLQEFDEEDEEEDEAGSGEAQEAQQGAALETGFDSQVDADAAAAADEWDFEGFAPSAFPPPGAAAPLTPPTHVASEGAALDMGFDIQMDDDAFDDFAPPARVTPPTHAASEGASLDMGFDIQMDDDAFDDFAPPVPAPREAPIAPRPTITKEEEEEEEEALVSFHASVVVEAPSPSPPVSI
jgi:hypothetical protein